MNSADFLSRFHGCFVALLGLFYSAQIAQRLERFPEKKKVVGSILALSDEFSLLGCSLLGCSLLDCLILRFGGLQGVAQLVRVFALGANGICSSQISLTPFGHLTQWLEFFSYKEAARVQFS